MAGWPDSAYFSDGFYPPLMRKIDILLFILVSIVLLTLSAWSRSNSLKWNYYGNDKAQAKSKLEFYLDSVTRAQCGLAMQAFSLGFLFFFSVSLSVGRRSLRWSSVQLSRSNPKEMDGKIGLWLKMA